MGLIPAQTRSHPATLAFLVPLQTRLFPRSFLRRPPSSGAGTSCLVSPTWPSPCSHRADEHDPGELQAGGHDLEELNAALRKQPRLRHGRGMAVSPPPPRGRSFQSVALARWMRWRTPLLRDRVRFQLSISCVRRQCSNFGLGTGNTKFQNRNRCEQ